MSANSPTTVDPTSLYLDAFVPTLEEWEAGDRVISCLLGSYETTMTGSAKSARKNTRCPGGTCGADALMQTALTTHRSTARC